MCACAGGQVGAGDFDFGGGGGGGGGSVDMLCGAGVAVGSGPGWCRWGGGGGGEPVGVAGPRPWVSGPPVCRHEWLGIGVYSRWVCQLVLCRVRHEAWQAAANGLGPTCRGGGQFVTPE